MALAIRDFSIEQGSTFILQFDLKDDDGIPLQTVSGSSIGNYSFRMKCIRSKYGGLTGNLLNISTNTLLESNSSPDFGNSADGFYLFSDHPGRVKFVISDTTTSSIKYGRHDYDIEIVNTKIGGGIEVTKVFVGKMTFTAEATN